MHQAAAMSSLRVAVPVVRLLPLIGIALLLLALSALSMRATAAENLHFAGFALAGTAEHTARAFPQTSRLLEEKNAQGVPLLQAALWKELSARRYKNLVLKADLADDHKGHDALSMAVVLDWENIATERLPGATKLVLDLHGQILVFDFASRQVLGSWPVAIQLIHTDEHDLGDSQVASLVRQMYFGGGTGKTLFAAASDTLERIEVKRSNGNYIRVVSVDLEEKALATLAEANQDPEIFASHVANAFGKHLSENQRVAYIPYTKGAAVGAAMAARFANGEVYQLELPTADYRIHLKVRGFKKVEVGRTSIETAWAYGSYMQVAIRDYDDSATYLEAPFKFGAVKKVVAGTSAPNDWAAYQESLFTLIDGITRQMSEPDRGWLTKWSDGKPVLAQMERVKGIIERCR